MQIGDEPKTDIREEAEEELRFGVSFLYFFISLSIFFMAVTGTLHDLYSWMHK